MACALATAAIMVAVACVDRAHAQSPTAAEGTLFAVAVLVLRIPRLLAFVIAVVVGIVIVFGIASGRRRLGVPGRFDKLALTEFACAAIILGTVALEAATIGTQPPIIGFICVPPVWVGIGIGIVLLGGCSSPSPGGTTASPPAVEDPCPSSVTPRDNGATYNGRRFTDFTALDQSGTTINFLPLASSPSGANSLGYVEGTYPGSAGNEQGYFKKVEVDVKTAAPCEIVRVERTRRTLPGHNIPGAKPDGADGPEDRSVIKVDAKHYWVVTDAPGFIQRQADLTYYKSFTLIATFKNAAGGEFTKSAEYKVLVRLDGAADLIPNPTPPP